MENNYDQLVTHVEERLFTYGHLSGQVIGNGYNSRRRIAKIAVDAAVDHPFGCYLEAEGGYVCLADEAMTVLTELTRAKRRGDEVSLARLWTRAEKIVGT